MEEEWRSVVGYEGTYEVSETGRIRRGDRELFGSPSGGYRNVSLCAGGLKEIRGVHRVVAEAFIPNPRNFPLVRHLNDVRDDNRVANLAWGTQSDNMYDAVKNGRNHEANKGACKNGHLFDRVERGQRICLTCRDLWRKRAQGKAKNTDLPEESPVHGTRNGYNAYECRCDRCREANASHLRDMYQKRREKEKQHGNS